MIRIQDLRINTKLLLLILIPIVTLIYFAIINIVTGLQEAQQINQVQELVHLSDNLRIVVHELQLERSQTAAFLGSEGQEFSEGLLAQRTVSDEAIANLSAFAESFSTAQFGSEFADLYDGVLGELDQLATIRSDVDSLAIIDSQALEDYSHINHELLDLISLLANIGSDTALGQSLSNFYLFLAAKELAASERAILAGVFAADRLRPGELGEFVSIVGGQESLLEAFLDGTTPTQHDFYVNTVQGKAVNDFLRLRQVALDNAALGNFGVAPDLWFQAATERINLMKQVEDNIGAELVGTATLLERQSGVQLTLIIVPALLAIALTLFLMYPITISITEPIANIMGAFERISVGDLTARADVFSQDELGQMAMSVNEVVSQLGTLVTQTRDQNDMIQGSIMKLLGEVSGVAEGDLTVEAEVTADMTGAIADSFNFMIEQLRNIIYDVQEATLHVGSSANEVQATTEYLAHGSETQAAQILDTSAAIDEMTVSIQQVSENAVLSAQVGQEATVNAKRGAQAVQATIQGMDRIREQVEETAKRIARLGRSSEEIGKIVQLIGDIADRTSILALNASIQAAAAGDAGRGFAVVAEEVERLADRSTEATRQIATLTRTIQSETQEAVASMQSATAEVVSGTKLAQEAGGTLTEIQAVSNRLAELIQSISLAAKQQARGSETIARAMNDIADVTQQTASGTKQAAVSISSLAVLADNLRNSVSTFKLPVYTNGHSEDLMFDQMSGYNGGHDGLGSDMMDFEDHMAYEEPDIIEISDYADISKLS